MMTILDNRLRLGAITALIVLSIVVTAYQWIQAGQFESRLLQLSGIGLFAVFTEGCFILGAALMAISAGESLRRIHPIHRWYKHIGHLRRQARSLAENLLTSKLFAIGFWLNFLGAIGTSLLLVAIILMVVPIAGWGLLGLILIDLVATFGWRVPLEIKRRKVRVLKQVKVRQATEADLMAYEKLQADRWTDENRASYEELQTRLRVHPEGMLVAEQGGEIVGMVYAMRLADYDYENPPSWYEITNNGLCNNHVPGGPFIFGVDLSTARGIGALAGDKLLVGIGRLAIRERIRWCMLGGRMPGYHRYQHTMSPQEYLWSKNERGGFLDPQVDFYTSIPGLKIIKALPHYFDDPDSCDYGVLLRWENPLYSLPWPRLWSALFPGLLTLEKNYLSMRKNLRRYLRRQS